MKPIGFGLDVSHHQDPGRMPWESSFRGRVDFVIARAGYGTMRDRNVEEHVRRARAIGAKVGLYLFFRPTQSPGDQFARLAEVARAVKLGDGDIVPTLDIEHDPLPKPGANVSPSWQGAAQSLVDRMIGEWGDAMVYITQREWRQLGNPLWVLQRPLWVAHYTSLSAPATPGGVQPTIWQHRVGPFDPAGPGGYDKAAPELDQNRLLRPLPLIEGDAPTAPGDIEQALRERALAAQTVDDDARAAVDEAFARRRIGDDDGPEPEKLT